MARLDEHLTRLATLSSAALRDEWQRVHDETPPRLPPELMRMALGYALQVKAHGKLPARYVRRLDGSGDKVAAAPVLSAGTQLVRGWNGRTISVTVVDGGFDREGTTYRSLSAIAREVTGAGWSGPRFFGLTARG